MSAIARQVGYNSDSAFGVAFGRRVGVSPVRFARSRAETTFQTAAEKFEGAIA